MDVFVLLASALAGWPAILGTAQAYVQALVLVAESLSRCTGAIFIAVVGAAVVSSGAHAQSRMDGATLRTTSQVDEALVVPVVRTDQEARQGESQELGSAIYSPFSAGAIGQQEHPFVASKASIAPEPDLTMTLAASAGGAIAFAWLLYRI
jgi:hypothetical protein